MRRVAARPRTPRHGRQLQRALTRRLGLGLGLGFDGHANPNPNPNQDAAQDGLGRRVAGGGNAGPPAHAKHGADLRARKYAAASAARDAARPPPAYAARVAAWAR